MRVRLTANDAVMESAPFLGVPIQSSDARTVRGALGRLDVGNLDQLAGTLAELGRLVDGGEVPAEGRYGLSLHVARDILESDPFFADEVERQNPLGRIDPEGAAQTLSNDRVPGGGLHGSFTDGDWPAVTWSSTEPGWLLIESLAPDGFVLALPPGTSRIELDLSDDLGDLDPGGTFDVRAGFSPDDAVGWPGEFDGAFTLQWRLYAGYGTDVEDGFEVVPWRPDRSGPLGVVQMVGRALEAPGVLCGRLGRRIAHGAFPESRDPRRAARERGRSRRLPGVAEACPDILSGAPIDPRAVAVVAVHGTMSSGIGMAHALSTRRTGWTCQAALYRYEHDTWLGIDTNANELAERIAELGLRRVVLVGHSRGGIVALLAAARLRRLPLSGDGQRDVRVVTWGAPFDGTPLVGAAEVGRRGVNGLVAAFGWQGKVLLEAADRALLRGLRHSLPDGIRDLRDGSPTLGILQMLADDLPAVTVGADHPETGLRHGFFTGLFDGPNDRVVSLESAHRLGTRHDAVTVQTDHFSYEDDERALAPVDAAVADLCRSAALERRAAEQRDFDAMQRRLRRRAIKIRSIESSEPTPEL